MMDQYDLDRARRVFLGAEEVEEPQFEAALSDLACTGLQWGGLLGILGILILIPVNILLLDRPPTWWYPAPMRPEVFVLWDEAVVALLCGAAMWVGRSRCRLSVSRRIGGTIAVLAAVVSLVHDAYRGVLTIEYLILIYLLAVSVIPYRPWQALLLGGVLTGVLYGLGHFGIPGTAAARPELVAAGHLVRMGFVTVVLTGVSALLYFVRSRQHRARREAEALHEQVARLERSKSRFFADLSRELRSPLTLILGPLRDVLEGRLGAVPEKVQGRLEKVNEHVRRLCRLVDQLFDLARLDEGALSLCVRRHDFGTVLRTVVPPLRQWAEDKGISFRVKTGSEPIEGWVDADRIRQVLRTLITNAVRYTPEGGHVRVRVGRTDDTAEIAIRDTGPGLPGAIQDRVFEPSESYVPVGDDSEAAPAKTDAEQWIGRGIGLAHALALTRRHGGDIEVKSEPGFGTELTVRLPLGREHVAEEDLAEAEEVGGGPPREAVLPHDHLRGGGAAPGQTGAVDHSSEEPRPDAPMILLVDDEADLRAYLADLLGDRYRVVTAAHGAAALDQLHDHSVDLVVSDVDMPGMDGMALCREIRDDDQLRHLPVILLTARPDNRTRQSDLKARADAYVSKPFDPAELTVRVENLIEIRQIVQDRIRLPDWMESGETTVSSEEAEFVERLVAVVNEHIDNSNFGVDWLADEMDLSARHLRRRIKETTGLSAAGFIRTRRLQRAATLFREGVDTISDVADAVGYRDPSYFSRLFRETFGCSPTEYADREAERPDGPDVSA